MKAVRKAIYDRLATDTTLTAMATGTRIYDTQAPPGATLPYIIFQIQSGGARPIIPRRLYEWVFVVKVVTSGMIATTGEDIIARVDYLLENHALVISGYNTYWLHRESPDLDYYENTDGNTYRHIGGSWRMRISKDS